MTAPSVGRPDDEQLVLASWQRFLGDDPLLREVTMAAALTRTFNAAVLAVMVDRPADDPAIVDAVARLTSHALVENRPGGHFALHEVVRRALQRSWLENGDAGERVRRLRRLEGFDVESYQTANTALSALAEVGQLLRTVKPERYLRARAELEDRMVRSATDAIAAALKIGPADGWTRMEAVFNEQETARRYSVCELFIAAYLESIAGLPDNDRLEQNHWAQYFTGRLAIARRRWAEARAALDAIPVSPDVDRRLVSWTLMARAEALRGLNDFEAAKAVLLEVNERNESLHVDDFNAAVPYLMISQIEGQLWNWPASADSARQSLAAAERYDNQSMQASAGISLASARQLGADDLEAARALVDCLYQIRVLAPANADANLAVSRQALSQLGHRSRRLFATLSTQVRQLGGPQWPHGELDLLESQSDLLAEAGDAEASQAALVEALKLAGEHAEDRVRDLELNWAGRAREFDKALDGGRINERVADDPASQKDQWTIARVLTNGGLAYLDAGELADAERLFSRAERQWQLINHAAATRFTSSLLAEVDRRRGDLAAARARFDALAPAFDSEAGLLIEDGRSRLLRDEGDFIAAAALATTVAQGLHRLGCHLSAIKAEAVAVECLASADPKPSVATDLAAAAAALTDGVRARVAFVQWQPTDDTQFADEHCARALEILVRGRGGLPTRRRAAREHLELASNLDGDNFWYPFEKAFVQLSDQHDKEARVAARRARKNAADDPVLLMCVEQLDSIIEKSPRSSGPAI